MHSRPDVSLDDQSVALFLEVPSSKVVLLQAYFELYEGVGICRTVDIRRSLVCILTTTSMVENCRAVLDAIRPETQWQFAPNPSPEDRDRYLGYFKKGL